jgi:hypothetical protein
VTLLGWERESETGFGETLLIYEDNSKGESGVFTLFPFQPEFWNRDCGRREADQGQAGGRGFSQPQRKERKVRAFVEEKRRSEGKGKIREKCCVFWAKACLLGEKLFQFSRRLRGERDERLRVARRELFGKVRYFEPTFGKRWERTCGFSDKESSGKEIFGRPFWGRCRQETGTQAGVAVLSCSRTLSGGTCRLRDVHLNQGYSLEL